MPKSNPDLVAHLQKSLTQRQQEKARMSRLHGKAGSLGLIVSKHTSSEAGKETFDGYALVDKETHKPLTGPNGKIAFLKTLDDLEAVLENIK